MCCSRAALVLASCVAVRSKHGEAAAAGPILVLSSKSLRGTPPPKVVFRKVNNLLTIWFTPRRSKKWHIFISSEWLHQICPVFNYVRGRERKKKKVWRMDGSRWRLHGAKSTLFMFGWQRVFSSAWRTWCAVVFGTSLHPSCPPYMNYPYPRSIRIHKHICV